MKRIKWVPHEYLTGVQKTSCGRLQVGGSIFIGHNTYVKLLDTKTGREYPCRTTDSAKAAARTILRQAQ